jgi:hypothetical protein
MRADTTVAENEPLVFTVSAADPDGDVVYTAPVLPRGAVFDPETATFGWTPDYDQAGDTVVVFSASSVSDTVKVTVTNVDRLPVWAVRADTAVAKNTPLVFSVSAVDPDGDVVYTAPVLPRGAVFAPETATFKWTPDNKQVGDTLAVFCASSVLDTVKITVTNIARSRRRSP